MDKLIFFGLILALAGCATASPWKNGSITPNIIETFRNPILDFVSPDPQILYHEGFYYMVLSSNIWPYVNGGILIYKSKTLTDFRAAHVKMVYHVPQGLANLWAPELHFIRGNLYIYFAMDDGNNDNHRMYVIQAQNPRDPMGTWLPEKRMYTQDDVDYWAIDGTVLEYSTGLYFIWSGWPDLGVGSPQNLYIAPMSDPTTISGRRVLLREPKFDWEGPFTLEGPYILQRAGRVFLVFSAHSTWGPDYCLGIMGLDNGLDPMASDNWWHNNDGCVFYRNDAENVFCTGHAAFTTSPNALETWIVFHATNDVNDPGTRRVARVEKLEWDDDNSPIFPRPSGDSRELRVPGGQVQETFTNPILDPNAKSADPMAIRIGDMYYFVQSTNNERELTILKSRWLTDFRGAERAIAYAAPPEHANVWAAEMHTVRGELYMYFTQDKTGESHKNYVIKANNPNDPMAGWSAPTRLVIPNDDHFAIDGTVLQYGNGQLYFVFCSVDEGVPMSLYIAPMSDPMTISGPRVLLRSPHSSWDGGVNEGPFIVQNADRVFLVFSGESTWTPDYCLSMMGIDNLRDPLVRENWWDDLDRCMFYKNEEEGIYCTGHAAFTTSPDGSETWMLYHATNDPNSNENSIRVARAARITWEEDHAPKFPRPSERPLAAPNGQPPRY